MEQVDELHRKAAPSQAAYELIHTHCMIVAQIAYQLAWHQNELYRQAHVQDGDAHSNNDFTAKAGGTTVNTALADTFATSSDTADCDRTTLANSAPVIGGTVPERLLDEHLVQIGGMLHDIGTYMVLKKKHNGCNGTALKFSSRRYIQHGMLGYLYLLSEGVDESIALFARNHTGVGLTREHVIAQELPLPPDDYVPTTLEQETVMVADKYHSKSVPPKFVSVDAYTARAERFGDDNRQLWLDLVDQYGRPDIPALAEHWNMTMI